MNLLRFKNIRVLFALFLSVGLFVCQDALALSSHKKESLAYGHYMKGVLSDRFGDTLQAIDAYKKALKFDPNSILINFHLAVDYIKLEKLEDAIRQLKAINKVDSNDIDAKILLSVIYSSQGKDTQAAEEYQKALETAARLNPKNVNIYHSLGKLYYQQKKFDRAIEVYKMIINLMPEDSMAHFFLGLLYEEKTNIKDAIEELKQSVKLNPEFADALNSLGYIYAEQGINLAEAETMIKKALLIQPENPAYIDSLGWVFNKMGRVDEAIIELEKAVSLLSDPEIHDHLGDAYFKKNNLDKAKEQWKKSIELDPAREEVNDKIKRLGSE